MEKSGRSSQRTPVLRSNHHGSNPAMRAVQPPPSDASPKQTEMKEDSGKRKEFSLRDTSIVSTRQFTVDDLAHLCEVADQMAEIVKQKENLDCLRGYLVASVFFQESTRTRLSFEAAVKRLGGDVVSIIGPEFSSVAKGETFDDTIRAIAASVNVIVIRHKVLGSAAQAAKVAGIPVMNAGDGPGEHPTQALLDYYTIVRSERLNWRPLLDEKGVPTSAPLNVAFVGDLKNGRTIHSLARLLAPFGLNMMCVSPNELRLPSDLVEELHASKVRIEPLPFEAAIRQADVVYMTRVQREYQSEEEKARPDPFQLTPALLSLAKEEMIVMHPFPRNTEIDIGCDADPRNAYFAQMKNALPVRMALLKLVVGRRI